MSWSKEATIKCDAEGCLQHYCNGISRVTRLRKVAKENKGWSYRDGKDYCPEHA